MYRNWIILFFLLMGWRCTPLQDTRISIQIEGVEEGNLPILFIGEKEQVLVLDSFGYSECVIDDRSLPATGRLQCGPYRVPLYIEAGKSFGVYVNLTPELLGVEFKGEGAFKNEILHGKYLETETDLNFGEEEADFLREVESRVAVVDSLLGGLALDSKFYRLVREKYHYGILSAVGRYPALHVRMTGRSYVPSSFYLAYLDSLVAHSKPRMERREYREAIQEWVGAVIAGRKRGGSEEDKLQFGLAYLDSMVTDPEAVGFLTDHFIRKYVEEQGIDSLERWEPFYREKVHSPALKSRFEELCRSWRKIAPGQPLPSFTYLNSDSTRVSLQELSGDYLCLVLESASSEKVRLKNLEKRFAGKKIRFLGITYGMEWDSWKKRLEEKEAGGIQWLGREEESLPAWFRARELPYFIVLDKTGRIVRTGAGNPDDPATVSWLKHLEGL